MDEEILNGLAFHMVFNFPRVGRRSRVGGSILAYGVGFSQSKKKIPF